jgi:hypothetical protein
MVWLAVWVPTYAVQWGWSNFTYLCDVAVILTCVGLWFGNSLLLSSQAVGAIVINFIWVLDVAWRAAFGSHLLGGTEYMWDAQYPLWIRSLSFFHLAWPIWMLWAVRRVGYDRRAFQFQAALSIPVMAVAYFANPEKNINFSHRDPVFGWTWGPPPVHMAVMLAFLIAVIYWPTHQLLLRYLPPKKSAE